MTLELPGHEPDYRFTLANERTLLAWIRTALALLAGGVALVHLPLVDEPTAMTRTLGVLADLGAATCAIFGFVRWRQVQRLMRLDADLPTPSLPAVLVGIVVVGCLMGLTTVVVQTT